MMKALRLVLNAIIVLYTTACLAALGIMLVYGHGWFGVAPEALAAVYALLLAMPWTLLLQAIETTSSWLATLIVILGMALNLALLLWLRRKINAFAAARKPV